VKTPEEFAHEKLSPVLAMYRAKDFEDALQKAERLIADGGYGHTASLYIDPITAEGETRDYTADEDCRILVNTPLARRHRRPV
jgi:acetaldehyde dehydrogenase/alcohol dehydrogenase